MNSRVSLCMIVSALALLLLMGCKPETGPLATKSAEEINLQSGDLGNDFSLTEEKKIR